MKWEWTEHKAKIDGYELMFGLWVDRDYFPRLYVKIAPRSDQTLLEIICNRDIDMDEFKQHVCGPLLVKREPNTSIVSRLQLDLANNIDTIMGWVYGVKE